MLQTITLRVSGVDAAVERRTLARDGDTDSEHDQVDKSLRFFHPPKLVSSTVFALL